MSFTHKLTGMFKKTAVEEGKTVPFESLTLYIDERIAEEEEKIARESKDYVEGITRCVDELSKFLDRLKEMEREEMYKKLDLIVKNSQKHFADSLKNVIGRVRLESTDYKGLTKFFENVADALQQFTKLNRIHGRYLYLAFDKEMKNFSKTAKEMSLYHQWLGKVLHAQGEKIAQLRSLKEMISHLDGLRKEADAVEAEDVKVDTNVKRIETEIEELKKQTALLESSEEHLKLKKMKERKKELEEALKSTEGEIYNVLHPLDRDFRKFKREVETGRFPFDVKLLEKYEKLTEEFLKEKEGYPILKRIAEKMKEALEKDIIQEEAHKKQKVEDILQSILNDGLSDLQRRYHSLKKQIESESSESDILKKIENSRKEIEGKKGEISDLKTKKENLIHRKKDIQDSIHKVEEEIREKCSKVGITVD